MELVVRRRSKGLFVLLSLIEAMVTFVQTEHGHSSLRPVVVRLSLYIFHTSSNFSFSSGRSIHSPPAFFANLSRGPPESAGKPIVKHLME
jgi:hypothetical protein